MRCTAAARPEGYSWLDLLDESYNRFAWHGPNLTQALRGVDATQANWRPPSFPRPCPGTSPKSRAMWRTSCGIVVSVSWENGGPLLGEIQRTFPLSDALDEVWTNLIGLLDESYNLLRQAVSETTLARLAEMSPSLTPQEMDVLQRRLRCCLPQRVPRGPDRLAAEEARHVDGMAAVTNTIAASASASHQP